MSQMLALMTLRFGVSCLLLLTARISENAGYLYLRWVAAGRGLGVNPPEASRVHPGRHGNYGAHSR